MNTLIEKMLIEVIGNVVHEKLGREFKVSIKEDETGYTVHLRLDKEKLNDWAINNLGKSIITINKKYGGKK